MSRSLLGSEFRKDGVSPDAVVALIERISKSAEFGQSIRSQEVLRYLCGSVLKNPEQKITEHQIGVSVFGWNPDRDPGDDTSVRVQISQLRKRLEHYFAFEGLNEPIRVRLPKGSYSPVFEARSSTSGNVLPPVAVSPVAPAPPRHTGFAVRLLVATNLAPLALAIGFAGLARTTAAPASVSPNLDQFWTPFRGRPAQVVLSDGNLVVLGEMLGREIPLHEYRAHLNPSEVVRSSVSDGAIRSLADRGFPTHLTGTQDVDVFGMVSSLLTRYRVPVGSISAPDFQMSQLDNVILLGHPRVNPWIHLFDDRLNFHYRFDWKERKAQIVNISPVQGEQAVYTADFGNHGYCVVACLPKPIGEGTAVLIYGSDMSSLEAGGKFVTDDQWIARLYARLHVTARNAPRYMEVLLRTELLDSMAPGFDIVAYRLPSGDPPGSNRPAKSVP
jgi:hypothetical protein